MAGEKFRALSSELWKRQALIDAGRAEGINSLEADELAQAHKTIVEVEAVKAASALFNAEEPISQKAVPAGPRSGPFCRGQSGIPV